MRGLAAAILGMVLGLVLGTPCAMAQDWPARTVRMIVPFAAGATPDVVARLIAEHLQQQLGHPFIVENKPGASGNTGTDAVAKAAADGITIGISIGGPLAINTLLFRHLPYDPTKDLTLITMLVTQPSVLAINSSLGVSSVAELIALIRNNPGKYNFGSIGTGSIVASRHGGARAQERDKAGARALCVLAPGSDRADAQ